MRGRSKRPGHRDNLGKGQDEIATANGREGREGGGPQTLHSRGRKISTDGTVTHNGTIHIVESG